MSASGQDGPPDPFGPMAEAAVAIHQVFLAYIAAGFSDSQALYLIGQMLTASVKGPGQ